MTIVHRRACHLCEAICGLEIETEGSEIVAIRGDKSDPLSRGHICPKAVALQDLHEDPDRLRQPVKKTRRPSGEVEFVPVSWEQALDAVAGKLVEIRERHGEDALGVYMGNPSVHNYGMMTHQKQLFGYLRTRNRFSATSLDQLPHHLVGMWLYGHKSLFPIPDIDRTDFMLVLGGNPLASNGSIWTVPDVRRRIKDLKARGGRMVVIDPRRTETAELAGEHHFIQPGSDALLLLAMLNTLFTEGLVQTRHLTDFVDGLDEVAMAVAEFTPELAARHTGIEAASIRSLARDFAAAGRAVCYGRMGVSVQEFGTLCQWLVHLLNIATGNLDRPGGALFTRPAFDNVALSSPGGFDRFRSRISNLPEFDRELPAVTLAEEITTPGEGQIRAMFTGAGNPVLSSPEGSRLADALASLEFMVSLDPYINETTRFADYILPPTSPLEHDHYDLAFHGLAVRNTARFNLPVFDKPEGALHDWEIFHQLGCRVARLLGEDEPGAGSPADFINMGLQAGPYSAAQGSELGLDLDKLLAHPSGIDLGPLEPQLPQRLFTPEKRIPCNHPAPMADLERVRQVFQAPRQGLSLIGRRHVRSNNSWMHNFQRLVKGKPRCTLLMHPDDAGQRALDDGAAVKVSSRVGEVVAQLQLSEDVMPGVVSLPHGWGHGQPGARLEIAARHAGVSCNELTDTRRIDALSGNAVLNGVPVEVSAA